MRATLTVLGSGTSMGVPTIGCTCAVCHSNDPHDRRTRPSILLEYNGAVGAHRFRPRFSRAGPARRNHPHRRGALYPRPCRSHPRARRSAPAQLPPRSGAAAVCRRRDRAHHRAGLPLCLRFGIDLRDPPARRHAPSRRAHFELFGATFITVPLRHGDHEIVGFRFGEAAYLTDFSSIPENSMLLLARPRHPFSRCPPP